MGRIEDRQQVAARTAGEGAENPYGASRLAQWGVADRQLTGAERWLCFAAMFVFGTFCMYQNVMVAPILTQVGAAFGVGLGSVGLVQSLYAVAGLVLAYPAAGIMRGLGIKFSLLVATLLTLLGSVFALLSSSWGMFLVARVFQGCGFGFVPVLGASIMPRVFPGEKMGLVMGIWAQWVVPGTIIGALSTPALFSAFGWQSVFVLSTALQIVATVLLVLFIKMPAVPENVLASAGGEGSAQRGPVFFGSALVVALMMVPWNALFGAFNTYYPTYVQDVQGMALFPASMTTMVTAVVTAPFGIAAGVISSKVRQRKLMMIAGFAVTAVLFATFMWGMTANPALSWVASVLFGAVCCAIVPTLIVSYIPVLAKDPKKTDYAMATLAFGTQVGYFIVALFGSIASAADFHVAALVFGVPICIAAIVALLFVKGDRKAAGYSPSNSGVEK